MKKILAGIFILTLAVIVAAPVDVSARMGDLGFHGGVSEGRHLPRTTETIIIEQGNARNGRNRVREFTMEYREYVFLEGVPYLFEGLKTIRTGEPAPNSTSGTFRVEHRVRPPQSADTNQYVHVYRTMIFDVEYRREGTNIIYTYVLRPGNSDWVERISFISEPDTGGNPEFSHHFILDRRRSSFNVSTIEDRPPAIHFYRGDVSARLHYNIVDADDDDVSLGNALVEKVGSFHGFSSAWSAVETLRLDVTITNNGLGSEPWVIQYQIRPNLSVNKILQWVSNEPSVISFEGNFRELHQSFGGLRYDVFVAPQFWTIEGIPMYGTLSMETSNVFEQLPAPNVSFLRGHPAEDDIHRLFAMQILTGPPAFFIPEQAISRGQFLTALARAINLPVQEVVLPRAVRGQPPPVLTLFSDVTSDRPEFRYIQALQQAGVAFGRADGMFYFDYPISRQEAITTVIRAMGLINMTTNPTVVSPFIDSDAIANWAIGHVNVAYMLGIISPDAEGNLHPNRAISKGEAAALLNRLLEYLRVTLVSDYGEQIVNIAR